MVKRVLATSTRWAIAAGVGATAGLMVWWGGSPYASYRVAWLDAEKTVSDPVIPADCIAMRYAEAVQEGDCDEIIRMTWWITERLQRLESLGSSPTSLEAARAGICEQVQDRGVEGRRLRREGVEDQYVFAPGASIEPIHVDVGRTDLAKPVHDRTWVRVIYPAPERALLDEAGRPIRSIAVGVNVSKDGYVLKAGVIGNLDVGLSSVLYDWELNKGA